MSWPGRPAGHLLEPNADLFHDGAALALPGSGASALYLAAAEGEGYPVIRTGYSSSQLRFLSQNTPSFPHGALLLSPTGQALYLNPTPPISPQGSGVWQMDFSACPNPLAYTEGMRLYPAASLSLRADGNRLYLSTNGASEQAVASGAVSFRYVYGQAGSEQVGDYVGVSQGELPLYAVGIYAGGSDKGVERNFTVRLPMAQAAVPVRRLEVCGGSSSMAGVGRVNLQILGNPPQGDVDLSSGSWTRKSIPTSMLYTDVPVGVVSMVARSLWSGDTLWQPDIPAGNYPLTSYLPLVIRVTYSPVPGTLVFRASGFPSDGTATLSAGSYSAAVPGGGSKSVSATPGVYSTSATPEVSLTRYGQGVSWTEIYPLSGVSPAQVRLRSQDTVTVSAAYSGPLPGTLCEDNNCRTVAPGAYTAPQGSVINTYPKTYSKSCPAGQTGSITVTETWQTVKSWSPSVVGVSSRGTSRFTSGTSDQLVSQREQNNCAASPPPATNIKFTVEGLPAGLQAPYVVAQGSLASGKVPNGTHTYSVSPGSYSLNFQPVSTNPDNPDPSNTYYPNPQSLSGYAAQGETTDLGTVRYILSSPSPPSDNTKIRFTIAGLPAGTTAPVSGAVTANVPNGTYSYPVLPNESVTVNFGAVNTKEWVSVPCPSGPGNGGGGGVRPPPAPPRPDPINELNDLWRFVQAFPSPALAQNSGTCTIPVSVTYYPDKTSLSGPVASGQTTNLGTVTYSQTPPTPPSPPANASYTLRLNVRYQGSGTPPGSPLVCMQPTDTLRGGSIDPNAEIASCAFR